MNKLLNKLANNTKMQKGVIFTGLSLATISNALVYVGLYYMALHKGVEIRDEYYEEVEGK